MILVSGHARLVLSLKTSYFKASRLRPMAKTGPRSNRAVLTVSMRVKNHICSNYRFLNQERLQQIPLFNLACVISSHPVHFNRCNNRPRGDFCNVLYMCHCEVDCSDFTKYEK